MCPIVHVGKAQKTSSIVLIVAAATSPSRSIEITCNQVNFLRNQYDVKSQDEIFSDSFLLGVDVADMQGQTEKNF